MSANDRSRTWSSLRRSRGEGDRREAVVEGPRRLRQGPLRQRCAKGAVYPERLPRQSKGAATSPSLRDREDHQQSDKTPSSRRRPGSHPIVMMHRRDPGLRRDDESRDGYVRSPPRSCHPFLQYPAVIAPWRCPVPIALLPSFHNAPAAVRGRNGRGPTVTFVTFEIKYRRRSASPAAPTPKPASTIRSPSRSARFAPLKDLRLATM
jgi:hypothetical protein